MVYRICLHRSLTREIHSPASTIVCNKDGVDWHSIGEVTTDPLGHPHRFKAKLLHAYSNESIALDYWKMMMPDDLLASILYATNQQPEMRHHPLTYNTLHHFLGIILAMALAIGGISGMLKAGTDSRNEFWEIHGTG